jgi:hypothetical protein
MDDNFCPKCSGAMKKGIALEDECEVPSSTDDWRTGRPRIGKPVPTGKAKLIDVMKCSDCGHSRLYGDWK